MTLTTTPDHVVSGDLVDAAPSPSSVRRTLLARHGAIEVVIAVFALGTNLWNLSAQGLGNAYYAAAVRSMTQSWTNFFFASFDPGGWITVDKPPLAWWVPAALAKIFGVNSWTLLGPSAVAGAVAVLLLTVTVRRVWGVTAGIGAGLALATMPTAVAVSRSNNPDVWLVLGVVAAAWAMERAFATGQRRWLVGMGSFIGLAFLAKLGAALIVVPGLWLAYLLAAPASWKRRIADLAIATVTFVAVAFVWVGSTVLIPASSRPFIGGSTDGSAWNLVTGYNGLGRLVGNRNGGQAGGGALRGGPGGFGGFGGSGVNSFGGSTGIGRLFNMGMGDQVMWLIVPATAAAVLSAWLIGRRRLGRSQVGFAIAFTVWLVAGFVTFSFAKGTFHNYYVALIAPAIAGLFGMGIALVRGAPRSGRLLAAVLLLATAAVQVVFLRRVDALTALRVVVPLALVASAIGLAVMRRARELMGASFVSVVAVVASLLLAPAAWSLSSVGHASSGSFPEARPVALEMNVGAGGNGATSSANATFGQGASLTKAELTWLRSQRQSETWLLAVSSSMQASTAIINGDSVMAMGGFSGGDPAMNKDRLATLVRAGSLRFVSVGGGFGGAGGFGEAGGATGVTSVVTATCTNVPSSTWGATGTSTLYDCAGKADVIASYVAPAVPAAAGTAGVAGASPGTSGTQGAGAPPAGFDFAAIESCLTAKGLPLPDPSSPISEATTSALQACGISLPGGPPPN